jgi:hypothetical protein
MAYNDDERSSLWGLGALSALAGGTTYALLKHGQTFKDAFRAGSSDLPMATANAASQTTRFAGRAAIDSSIPAGSDAIMNALRNMSSSQVNRGDLRGLGYRAIMSGGKTTHEEAMRALSSMDQFTDIGDIYNSLASTVSKSSGDTSVLTRGITGLGSSSRASAGGVLSSGITGVSSAQPISSLSQLGPKYRSRLEQIQGEFASAFKASGIDSGVAWEDVRMVSDTIRGKQVNVPVLTGHLAGETLNIPLANVGKTYGGANLSSRYVTRKAYMSGGRKLSYADLVTKSTVDAIRSSTNKSNLKDNVRHANQFLIDAMNDRDSAARAAAVWFQPESMMTSGGLAKARLISQEAVPYGAVSEAAATNLIGKGFHPYVSPDAAAKNILTTRNLVRDVYGDLGGLIEGSPELRPMQGIRSEWGATEKAKRAATPFKGTFGQYYNRLDPKMKGSAYDRLMYGGRDIMHRQAYSAPQQFAFYAKPGPVGWRSEKLNRMLAPEQGVISGKGAEMMEYERIFQKKIAIDKGLVANEDLLSGLQGKKYGGEVTPMSIGQGSRIGIEKGTGKEVFLESNQSVIGAELSGPNEAKAYIRETRKLTEDEYFKMFGLTNKSVVTKTNDLGSYLKLAGLDVTNIGGQDIEALYYGKMVARNPTALAMQQIEAVSKFVSDKTLGEVPADIHAFLSNPTEALGVKNILSSGAEDAHYQIQKNLVGLAKGWGLSQREMNLSFGLMDRGHISRMAKEGVLGWREAAGISRSSGVIGLDKGRLGDLVTEGGSGGLGSFEQSGFRLLSMKGEEGKMFAAEMASRLQGKGELSAIEKMEATVLGQEGIISRFKRGSATENFIDLAADNLIQQEGRFVNVGRKLREFGNASSIYVPGLNEANELLSPVSAGGKSIESPLARSLANFQRALQGGSVGEELESAAASLRNTVGQISAQQSSGAGKILGSAYLGGIRKDTAMGRLHTDAVRMSPATANQMFGNLIERASGDQRTFLEEQLAGMHSNTPVYGAVWRHPTTGPESLQFSKMVIDKELADNLVAMPYAAGKIQFQDGRVHNVDVSSLVGQAGDFDADHYNVAAIANRDTSARIAKRYQHQAANGYTNYLFNHYAMKDMMDGKMSTKQVLSVASEDAISKAQRGYGILGRPKRSTGQVNVALQKFKLALGSANPEGYRPIAEALFHLEQAAISKHGETLGGGSLFQDISSAASGKFSREKSTDMMESVFTRLMGEKRSISGKVMNAAGEWSEHTLNYDPRQMADTLVGSLEARRSDVNAAMKAQKISKGREAKLSLNDLTEAFNSRRQGSIDPAIAMPQRIFGGEADKFTQKASSLLGRGQAKASAFMGALGKAKKPIMAGAAIAAGIMLMAPPVSGRIGSGEGARGGGGMSSDSFGPSGGEGMLPPPPRPNIAPKVYDMGSGRQTTRANIRMHVNDLDRSSRDFMQSARELSNGGQVHIRARDDRAALDPRMLANKIQERL